MALGSFSCLISQQSLTEYRCKNKNNSFEEMQWFQQHNLLMMKKKPCFLKRLSALIKKVIFLVSYLTTLLYLHKAVLYISIFTACYCVGHHITVNE